MRRSVGSLFALTLACRAAEPEPEAEPTLVVQRSEPASGSAFLDGALLDGRYPSVALAELARRLPRPTPTGSPLVAVFIGLVAEFEGEPRERLAAAGVQADATIELSIRALDGRAASARKLLGELMDDDARSAERLARLRGEAGTLGLHLRASIPITDEAKLRATLARVVGDPDPTWAPICAQLAGASWCAGPERLLIWARPQGDACVRLDAIYLFTASGDSEQLAWIVARADGWGSPTVAPTLPTTAAIELELRALPTLRLLEAEALADAIVQFEDGELDHPAYHAYLDREQALRDLVPDARVFDGVRTQIDVEPATLRVTTRWIAAERPPIALAELFAPLPESFDLPPIDAMCHRSLACARMVGLSLTPRFAPLARGPFVDTTGAARVLRQAGDRGPILLGLGSWPNLLGTAGRMAEAERGWMAEAQAALIDEAYAVGGVVLELDPDPAGAADQWIAYLRMGPNAFATVRPLADLTGLEPRPLALAGVAGLVDRAVYDNDGDPTRIYFVDEREQPGGIGGWLLAADTDARASWLLSLPRESSTALDPIGYLQIRELGTLAAREDAPFGDDPPVRRWLDQQALTIELRLTADGPLVEWRLVRQAP